MGPNVKEYWNDLKTEYGGAIKDGDPLQKGLGVVGGAASAVLEGTDVLWSGLVDEKYERPEGFIGRTRRDAAALLKNAVTLHPLRTLGNGWRLLTSDIPMDTIDLVGGFHQETSRASHSQVQALLSNEPLPKHYLN